MFAAPVCVRPWILPVVERKVLRWVHNTFVSASKSRTFSLLFGSTNRFLSCYRDFNPYGGCIPGSENGDGCPWHRSKKGDPWCESSADFAGVHALRSTPELCCKQHFSQLNQDTCVEKSRTSVVKAEAEVAQTLSRESYHYPDMHGKLNCVFDNLYEDWMMGAVSSSFDLYVC